MKLLIPVALILFASLFTACSKSGEAFRRNNCDSLVTDTAGSGDNGRIFIPNAFSPNGDGLNDVFRPITQNIDSIQFTIYDEDNTVVFTSNILGVGWTPAPGGLPAKRYFYKLQTKTTGGKKIGVCGDVASLSCFTVNPPKSSFYFEDMLTAAGFTGTTAETLATCQ